MSSGIPVTSLRLANVTGPRLAIGPIPTFYQRLKQGKSCFCSDTKRDFLHMEDFFSVVDVVAHEAYMAEYSAAADALQLAPSRKPAGGL